MTFYLASGKDPSADSGQWIIIVEAKNSSQAKVRIRQRLFQSRHHYLVAKPYNFQTLPISSSGLVYCDCTGEPQ